MNEPLLLILNIMAGTLLAFLGWSVYRTSLRVIGFLVGCAIGIALTSIFLALIERSHPEMATYTPWIVAAVALILGLINARLFLKFYYFVIFIAGALYGISLKLNIIDYWPQASDWLDRMGFLGQSPWAEILAALLMGLFCVLLHKYLIILLTSLLGAGLIVLPTQSVLSVQIYWAFPVIAILGSLSQLGFLRWFRIPLMGRSRS